MLDTVGLDNNYRYTGTVHINKIIQVNLTASFTIMILRFSRYSGPNETRIHARAIPIKSVKILKIVFIFRFYIILYVLIFSLGVAGKADYVAFATDYDNYGAIYSCQRYFAGNFTFSSSSFYLSPSGISVFSLDIVVQLRFSLAPKLFLPCTLPK